MTMQALPTQPEVWRPTPGFHCAKLQRQSKAKAIRVVEQNVDKYWEGFWRDCDALMLAEYPTPTRDKRLARYLNKPVQEAPPPPPVIMTDAAGKEEIVPQMAPVPTGSWLGQKLTFPRDFQDDLFDWLQLEPISLRRDQVLRELAQIEMMMTAEQAMGAPPALPPPAPPTSGVVEDLPDIGWSA